MTYEARAARWLQEQGYEILWRNFRCRFGEIDIIAWAQDTLVFVEVKYRGQTGFGSPEEAVTAAKQRHISNAALYYIKKYVGSLQTSCRFDVVCMENGSWRLYRHAFSYCGDFSI